MYTTEQVLHPRVNKSQVFIQTLIRQRWLSNPPSWKNQRLLLEKLANFILGKEKVQHMHFRKSTSNPLLVPLVNRNKDKIVKCFIFFSLIHFTPNYVFNEHFWVPFSFLRSLCASNKALSGLMLLEQMD